MSSANQGPPDSWIESPANGAPCDDAGPCPNCHKSLDAECECTEEERESAPTLREQEENYWHDRGEESYLREAEDL
jgi:hypothetical protein